MTNALGFISCASAVAALVLFIVATEHLSLPLVVAAAVLASVAAWTQLLFLRRVRRETKKDLQDLHKTLEDAGWGKR